MRPSKPFFALLLVVIALATAATTCDIFDVLRNIRDADFPVTPVELRGPPTTSPNIEFPYLQWFHANAVYGGASSGDQASTAYGAGVAPTTPFSQLFGNLDQAATMASLKAAIPDLKYSQRMSIQQNDWVALAYDLSGTFTQPMVTASGSLPPTNKPWFTTVHTIIHFNADQKIDQEYSVADMASMLQESGVPGYENVSQSDIEKPMSEEIPSDDPTATGIVTQLIARMGGGAFSAWLPSGVPNQMPTSYHSPYGDAEGVLPEVESKLLLLQDAQVVIPVIIQQGNSVGVLYRYNGTIPQYPIKFSNGVTVQPSDTPVQFIGIALGDVDASGHFKAWNMINRLDNPISPDTYAPAPGITTTQEVAPEATPITDDYGFGDDSGDTTDTEQPTENDTQATSPAPVATPASGAAAATCSLTAPQKANLRQGPGTSFTIGGSLAAGQSANADGQANDGNGRAWYHLSAENLWVRSDLISGDCAALPTVTP